MATETQLIGWTLQNAVRLNLKVDHTTWIEEFFPGLIDIQIRLGDERFDNSGWGWGRTSEESMSKAIAEALERLVFRSSGFQNTSGMAAHLDFKRAATSAINELRERDLFLSHFYAGVPFKKIEDADLLAIPNRLSRWLSEKSVQLKLFRLGERGILCLIDGRQAGFGFSVGAAIKDTAPASVISACIEAGRNVHRMLTGIDPAEPLSLDQFSALKQHSFAHHGRLAQDIEYANRVAFLFEGNGRTVDSDLGAIDVEELHLDGEEYRDCPLKFARASSPIAQKLFTGLPTPSAFNLDRMSTFAGRKLNFEDLSPLPHPFY